MTSGKYFGSKYLKAELSPIFKINHLPQDIIAGIIVALVAIPLSLAVAIASSVPPEIGLISAIFGGIIAAIFGGTTLAITGPAIAMTVIISQCIQEYGMGSLIIMGMICGILQILFGMFSLGRFTKLIPVPVVSAFIAAIGFIIFFGQLPKAFQLNNQDKQNIFYVFSHLKIYSEHINSPVFLIAILTIVLVIMLPKFMPKAVAFLIAVIVPSVTVYFAHLSDVHLIGSIPHTLPAPHLPDFSQIHGWHNLLMSSLAIFTIASLETLLSSNATDKLAKTRPHKPNQELIGQGLANLCVAVFGGIPVTAVIARSSVNISAGAKTRRSAIIHSLVILALVYWIPQVIENIPIAVLAGILLLAGLRMLNIREVIKYWNNDKLDLFIYAVTFLTIISSDLIDGIQAGLILALIIAVIRLLATKSNVQLWSTKSVIRISLSGNMSFWSFETLGNIQEQIFDYKGIKFVIFEFSQLQGIDNNGARNLVETALEIANNDIKIIFHGTTEEQQKLLNSVLDGEQPYTYTITENDIKLILEKSGIQYQTTDVLRHGIAKFSSRFAKDNKQLITTLAQGQKPHTLLITCSDSRLDPNAFFSSSIGELFIVRNVGNVIPQYSLDNKYSEVAAIEFALGALGVKNIVVCAHTECGAIKASISDFEKNSHSGLDNWLQYIKDGYGNRAPHTIDEGVRVNLLNQLASLKTYPIVNSMLNNNELTISALIYDVHSATMLEWSDEKHAFISTQDSAT